MKTYKQFIKEFNSNISYVGGVRLGSHGNFKPIASLGDMPPKRVNATYMYGRAAGSLRPFLKAQKKDKLKDENFTPAMISRLKKAYGPLKGKRISLDDKSTKLLMKIIDKIDKNKNALIQLYKADIPFVSQMAASRLISKHNMGGRELNKLKEELDKTVLDKYLDSITIDEMRSKEEEEFESELV